ncbi:MAG: H-NS histone family protein [Pseudomonadota bacterium]
MAIDLDKMSKKELEQLIVDAKAAMGRAADRERLEAREAAEKVAAEYGFSLSELASGKTARKKASATGSAKYANPENPMQTWTGKGRQPTWYKDAVAAGTPPEAMEV